MKKKTDKKGILINLDSISQSFLRTLAEQNSSSMSQEVRRLILNEKRESEQRNEWLAKCGQDPTVVPQTST